MIRLPLVVLALVASVAPAAAQTASRTEVAIGVGEQTLYLSSALQTGAAVRLVPPPGAGSVALTLEPVPRTVGMQQVYPSLLVLRGADAVFAAPPEPGPFVVSLPAGTYELLAVYAGQSEPPCMVVRHDVALDGPVTIRPSCDEATRTLSVQTTTETGERVTSALLDADWAWIHAPSGAYVRIRGRRIGTPSPHLAPTLLHTAAPPTYRFDWRQATLPDGASRYVHKGTMTAFGASATVATSPAALRRLGVQHRPERVLGPAPDALTLVPWVHVGDGLFYAQRDVGPPDLLPLLGAPFRQALFVMPDPRPGFLGGPEAPFGYEADHVLASAPTPDDPFGAQFLYAAPALSLGSDGVLRAGYPFEPSEPQRHVAGDRLTYRLGPHTWFGRVVAVPGAVRLYAASSTGRLPGALGEAVPLFSAQLGDVAATAFPLVLSNDAGVVQSGLSTAFFRSEPRPGGLSADRFVELPAAAPGHYRLFVLDESSVVAGAPGFVTASLEFDTSRPDAAPPTLPYLMIVSDGTPTDRVAPGAAATVEFAVLDDPAGPPPIVTASVFVNGASAVVPVQALGEGRYRAALPADAPDGASVSLVVQATDASGNAFTYTAEPAYAVDGAVAAEPVGTVDVLVLDPPAPNPARSQSAVSYRLPAAGHVSLRVYDVLGREVAVLVDAWRPAGRHAATLDVQTLPAGAYLCRLTSGGASATRAVTVLP